MAGKLFLSSMAIPCRPSKPHYSSPTQYLLSSLTNSSTLNHLTQTHASIVLHGLYHNYLLLTKLIHAASLLGFPHYAHTVFSHIQQPNTYLYNTIIRALSQTDSAAHAIHLFDRMRAAGLRPDTYSFPYVLKAVSHLSDIALGRDIHSQTIKSGLVYDVHISTALIYMYSACRALHDARILFDEITVRDVVVWNAMVAGYTKLGDVDSARTLFEQMPERNVISWTTLISGYTQTNQPAMAVVVFRRMQVEECVEPDEIALLAVLSACAQLGALDLGEWVHWFIDKRGLCKIVSLMNALIDMYAKSGSIGKALGVFENMKRKSVVTWTTMIAGFALHGLGVEALEMFSRMERSNVQPNDVTFVAILSACCHIGETDLGHRYFDRMISWYRIKPRIEHYGCLVDLLGRAGCLREAQELIKGMPVEANGAIWGALLAAARIHRDVEVGEFALSHLIDVEPHNSGNYILLSNIYATYEKWDKVGNLRKLMKDRSVKHMTGGSCIEVDGSVYEFTSRDGSHPSYKRIYEVMHELDAHLKILGYVPNLCGEVLDIEDG